MSKKHIHILLKWKESVNLNKNMFMLASNHKSIQKAIIHFEFTSNRLQTFPSVCICNKFLINL